MINVSFNMFNTLRPRQNGRRFADNVFKYIFLNENVWISLKISLKFVPKGPVINIPALVQIMAWRRSGDKPLSEPMMVSLPTHICVTRPQWVKKIVSYCICSSVLRYSFVHSLFQLCLGNLCISKIQWYKNTALVSWKSDYRIRLEMKKDRQTLMKIVAQCSKLFI